MNIAQLWKMKSRIIESLAPRPSLWVGAILVSGFIAYYIDSRPQTGGDTDTGTAQDAATFIPNGFVLVPIEVSNFESLDSILGNYGIVDLYAPGDSPKKRPIKIAERIKILRAPLNPSHFAVLAPEDESDRIVAQPGPLMVVVQPKITSGTRIVKPAPEGKKKERSRSRLDIAIADGSSEIVAVEPEGESYAK
jgi:hypothetical protein